MPDTADTQPSRLTGLIIAYRNHVRPVLDGYKYLFLPLVWVAVFGMGYIGFSQLYPAETPSNLIYLTMHLFVMASGTYAGPQIILLDIARTLAPVLVYFSLIAIIAEKFYDNLELVWLRLFANHHIVVCGLGYVGSMVIRTSLSTKAVPLVVIERDPGHKEIEWCKRHGITVIIGDATDKAVLEQAMITSAQALYVATGSDEVNADVIARVFGFSLDRKESLQCYVHVVDPNFTNLLRVPQLAVSGVRPISLEFFNIYQIANFCILECLPDLIPPVPDPPDRHILIIGLGHMGEGLIPEIAKRWKQAYEKNPAKKIQISIIDRDAEGKKALLESRYASLPVYCEIIPYAIDILSVDFYQNKYLDTSGMKHPLDAVFLCMSDESLNFSTGLYLNQKLHGCNIPIIIRTEHRTGLVHFFNKICAKNADDYKNLLPFPLVSCSCCIESLVGMNELIARSIHNNYILMRSGEGASPDKDPAMKPWRTLDIEYKEASRSQAYHIKSALQSLGYSIISRTDWDEPLAEFTSEEVEKMAEAEHNRWWDDKVRRGWKAGPREIGKKTSPYLIPYDQLDEKTRDYDRNFVRLYPQILAMVDLTLKRYSAPAGEQPEAPAQTWLCSSDLQS